jgi:dTDP-4-amino-4,6-dideoxygalactose transaminase
MNLNGLQLPFVKPECTHAYYMYPMVLDVKSLGVTREKIIEALSSEGVPALTAGYANVHLLPLYQRKIAYGTRGFPWTSDICKRDVDYKKGICPVAEELHEKTYIGFEMCQNEMTDEDVDLVIEAFQKVWGNLNQLQ